MENSLREWAGPISSPLPAARLTTVIRNEVKEIMGGRVIELKAVTAWNEGLSQGLSQGRTEGVLMSIKNLMSSFKLTAEQAMDALKISEEDRAVYLAELNK